MTQTTKCYDIKFNAKEIRKMMDNVRIYTKTDKEIEESIQKITNKSLSDFNVSTEYVLKSLIDKSI